MSRSRVSISTLSRRLYRRLRKSWHFQKLDLDNREVLILSQHHLPVPRVSIEIKKSIETWIFGQSWQFVSILIESELILSFFLIDISQFVEIFEPEVPHCLEKSWLSQFIHILLMQISKSLNFKNLDWEKKCFLNMIDNLNNFQKLVAPLRTILISISIGLDCWDPQP